MKKKFKEKLFADKLKAKWAKGKFVCVGLDPDLEKIPTHLKELDTEERLNQFLHEIVKSVGSVVAAFKPNTAFFEKYGLLGIVAYESICQYIHSFFPHVIIIGDAKRGDIGNTNIGSADFLFNRCGVDAVTVHPYMGREALKPFLDRADKGVFVLCRTSNLGSGEFQDRQVLIQEEEVDYCHPPAGTRHIPFYQLVAAKVNKFWNKNGNCGLVTGATFSEDIPNVRMVASDLPLLIPGIGTQGGDLEQSVRGAATATGGGFIINSSSGILYASHEKDFAQVARAKAVELDKSIRSIMATVPKIR